MQSTQGAFSNHLGPIPDQPSGPNVYWVTIWFEREDARLANPALLRLMSFRIYNGQVTIDRAPRHPYHSNCLSLRIAGAFSDSDTVLDAANKSLDWYIREINDGRKFINRPFVFRL